MVKVLLDKAAVDATVRASLIAVVACPPIFARAVSRKSRAEANLLARHTIEPGGLSDAVRTNKEDIARCRPMKISGSREHARVDEGVRPVRKIEGKDSRLSRSGSRADTEDEEEAEERDRKFAQGDPPNLKC